LNLYFYADAARHGERAKRPVFPYNVGLLQALNHHTMSPPNPSESWHYHLRRGVSDVLYIILIILAFLLLLDLFGYHNTDPGWSTSGGAQDTQHFFGILGAYVADALFSALGYGAYLLPVGLGAIGWQGMRHTEFDTEMVIWKSLALLITLFAGLSMVAQIRFWSFKEINVRRKIPFFGMIILVLALMLLAIEPALVLFGFFLSYSLSGYVYYGWQKWRAGQTKR